MGPGGPDTRRLDAAALPPPRWRRLLGRALLIAVIVAVVFAIVRTTRRLDLAAVADALGRLPWWSVLSLLALLLARQIINAVPLSIFLRTCALQQVPSSQVLTFQDTTGDPLQLLRMPARESGNAAIDNEASMYWSIGARTADPSAAASLTGFMLTDSAAAAGGDPGERGRLRRRVHARLRRGALRQGQSLRGGRRDPRDPHRHAAGGLSYAAGDLSTQLDA